MFDKKIEPAAMKYVRASFALEEAKEQMELAREALAKLIPEGTRYITKDGDLLTHVKATQRKSWIVEQCKLRFSARIWKAIRVDAIDTKKLNGFIEAGELNIDRISDCYEVVPVRSSIRVTWAPALPRTGKVA